MSSALEGGFADPAQHAAVAFRAAMNTMARPGRIEQISGAKGPAPLSVAAATLIATLCDSDTGLYLAGSHNTDEIRAWVGFHTGAPSVAADKANFSLGTWDALSPITQFPIGTPEYPDRSTTLIVECDRLSNSGATLTGPGIQDSTSVALPDVAALQANAALFPLGVDIFFTAQDQLFALPRSTRIT